MKIDLLKAKKTMEAYYGMSDAFREVLDKKNEPIVERVKSDFEFACTSDTELVNAINEIKSLKKILNFSNVLFFETSDGCLNGYDPECSISCSSYSEYDERRAREAAQNWEQINSEIEQKIAELSKMKFVLFRKKKINELEEELRSKSKLRNRYLIYEEREKEKQECIENGGKEKVKDLQDFVENRQMEHAENVIAKHFLSCPTIVCYSDKFRSMSRSSVIEVRGKYLSAVVDEIHSKQLDEIIEDKVASI